MSERILTHEEQVFYGKTAENGITERVRKLNKQMHEAKYCVSLSRARAFTKIYKECVDEPVEMKKALAVAEALDTLPLTYNEGELIVGMPGDKNKAKQIAPEVHTGWIVDEGGLAGLAHRTFNPAWSTPEEQKEFDEEIAPFWYKRTILSKWRKMCPEDLQDKICGTMFGEPAFMTAVYGSHTHLDLPGILTKGTNAYKEYAQKKLDELDYMVLGNAEKRNYYRGTIVVLEAIERFSHRWADHMRNLAAGTVDPEKKAEMLKIAEMCDHVPHEPARNFWEALQAIQLFMSCYYNESTGSLVAIGRLDQFLYPFYKADIEAGTLTKEQAIELLQCWYIKTNNEYLFVDNESAHHLAGNACFQNVVLGGVDKDNNDAVNELSYIIIDAFIEAHILQPAICVRINEKTPESFKEKVLDLVGAGMGFPSIYNDAIGIGCAERYGNTIEDAREYSCSGCMEIGKQYSYWWTPGQWVNCGMVADLVMTNGIKRTGVEGRKCGERISVETGDPRDFKTFDEYMDALKAHMKAQMDMIYQADQFIVDAYQEYPLMIQSCFTNNCLDRGLPYHGGGLWSSSAPGYVTVGSADIADAAAAVKKLVFEEKKITMDELCKALDANFEGYEDIRQMCLAAPKWGNDDDYVDDLEKELIGYYADVALATPGILGLRDPDQDTAALRHRGGPSQSPVSGNIPYGLGVGALASGRKAMEPLGDSAGAYMGNDVNGPTAAIQSYGKVEWDKLHGGIVNMYVTEDSLHTEAGRKKMMSLLDGAMDARMAHIQFNIMDKKVLMDAKENPEDYPSMIVRVSGYSAYFVELDESVQDTIIDRYQHAVV